MVLALGIGLAINNARAVIEALLGHQSEFTRTPKYGIESRTQSWKKARYLPMKMRSDVAIISSRLKRSTA